ncbi:MAG: hypothetical protein COA79_11535 [Planctomycetota bacterium]|nr:MAG: hypothetical protein COA79_11535 [Planctomycetota bacterium]
MNTVLKVLFFPFILIPQSVALQFGKLLGLMFYKIDKRHRLEIIERMNGSIKLRGVENIEEMCKFFYLNFGLFIIELLRMPFITRRKIKKMVSYGQLEDIRELLAEGNGIIAVTGHFSNWEYAGMAVSAYDLEASAVAKPLKNKIFNSFLNKTRSQTGEKIIDQKSSYKGMLKAIKNNEIVILLLDFDAAPDRGGIFIPFFDKETATLPTAAILQQKTKAPIVFIRIKREPDLRHFHFEIDQILRYDESFNNEEGVVKITTKMNESYERFILDSPEQWLWLQRRWRFRNNGN